MSVVLAAMLVPGAFLRGEVLGQSTLLYNYLPWQPYAPPDLGGTNPLLYDAPFIFYPFLTHVVQTVQSWHFPLWSSGLYGGHPFLGAFQTAIFSPFTAIAYAVPLPHATVYKALAPLVVGGLGMFLFVRSLGLNTAACWFAGLAYLLNGFSVGWMEHPLTAVVCWLPWLLRATDALVQRDDWSHAGSVAAFVALVIVAGHPETGTKILLLAGAYAAAALIVERRRRWRITMLAYAAGVLLTAVQTVPFLEYLTQSEALLSREAYALNSFFLPAQTMITALVPDFFGNPAHGPYQLPFNRFGGSANYAEQALYAGIAVVLIVPAGLIARWHEWRVRFFAASAVVALALMFGAPGFVQVISAIPFLRVMILTRFGIIVIVSLIVLAAYGLDRLTRDVHGGGLRIDLAVPGVAAAATAAIVIAWVAGLDFLRGYGQAGSTAAAGLIAIALLLVVSGLVVLRTRRTISPAVFAVAMCVLLAGDLIAAARGFHPTMPASQVYPPVPELTLIRRDPGLFRVYGWGDTLVPNAAMVYGLQDVRGWDGMNPHRFTRLLDLGYLRQSSEPERHLRNPILLDLLNVKYVFVGPEVSLPEPRFARVQDTRAPLYVNTRAFPRAFLVDDYRVLSDAQLEGALHGDSTDLARVALLETELPEGERPEPSGTGAAPGTVDVRHYRDTFVELDVDSFRRTLLVMSDGYYPGWTATINGQPVPIRRANFAIRAVAIPPGRHVVRFEYRPLSVLAGAIISAVTLAALGAVALTARRRRRKA